MIKLEDHITYWVDAGLTRYSKIEALQRKIVERVKSGEMGDVIISTEHHPEVNFGSSQRHNLFSNSLLEEVERKHGQKYNKEDIISVLSEKGYHFSETSRGGGATVFSPGQRVYYLLVDHTKITGEKDYLRSLAPYKKLIYGVLFKTLHVLGVEGINIRSTESYETRNERRDVWIQRNGISLKMGSKGIKLEKNAALYGFALFVDNACVQPFSLVKPCGYEPHGVRIASIEEVLKRRVPHDEINEKVKNQIKEHFKYSRIEEISMRELLRLIN